MDRDGKSMFYSKKSSTFMSAFLGSWFVGNRSAHGPTGHFSPGFGTSKDVVMKKKTKKKKQRFDPVPRPEKERFTPCRTS